MKLKNQIKLLFTFLSILLLAFTPLSGCAGYQSKANDPNENIIDTDYIISYCAKEKSNENRIFFNYPQFNELVPNADKLNQLIENLVINALQRSEGEFKGNLKDSPEIWEWNEDEYIYIAMVIDYSITRDDSDYFSVTFEGEFNHKLAAHPLNYFNSLIIDVKKCEPVKLSDLYIIDIDFVKLVRKKYKEQIRPGLAKKTGSLLEDVSEWVEESLSSDDTFLLEALHQSSFHCFFTDTALGINIPLGRVMGDHFEIFIDYEELTNYKSISTR